MIYARKHFAQVFTAGNASAAAASVAARGTDGNFYRSLFSGSFYESNGAGKSL